MIHLYCLAVQAGFYSDVVECSPQDRKVSGSILGWGMMDFLRVRDYLDHSLFQIIEIKSDLN